MHNALKALEDDDVVIASMGDHLFQSFMDSKSMEWMAYRQQVGDWERDQYLELY